MKAARIVPFFRRARSKQDPTNCGCGAQSLYRPPPAGATFACAEMMEAGLVNLQLIPLLNSRCSRLYYSFWQGMISRLRHCSFMAPDRVLCAAMHCCNQKLMCTCSGGCIWCNKGGRLEFFPASTQHPVHQRQCSNFWQRVFLPLSLFLFPAKPTASAKCSSFKVIADIMCVSI